MRNRALLLGLISALVAGCQVKKDEDGEGVEIAPAPVEIQQDTKSVVVPDVNLGTDTASRDTTHSNTNH
jgi:hypothetical protein